MKMGKNIWIINQYAGSSKHGMTFRSFFLAKEFNKNHNVRIFSASFSHVMTKPPKINKAVTHESIEGVNFTWLKVPVYYKSKSIKRVLSMFHFLFRLLTLNTTDFEKPDIIIVSSPSPLPIFSAYLWSKKYNAKLIFEVRDIWPLSIIEIGRVSKLNPLIVLFQLTENFAYRVTNYVVSVLPKAFDHMKFHGLTKEKFVYIPNGIEINNQLFSKESHSTTFRIGYAGTFGLANALNFLLLAAELTKNIDVEYHLMGSGPEKKNLEEHVKNLGLSNVFFHDAVLKNRVKKFLDNMHVLYIGCRKKELYKFGISPNKIFDYMLSEKPIIHSVDAGNDPVADAKAGISVRPENPELIAQAVLKLYNMSEDERKLMGENGRKYVEKHHSYQQLAKQYEQLFV